jgi:hypothetical protein
MYYHSPLFHVELAYHVRDCRQQHLAPRAAHQVDVVGSRLQYLRHLAQPLAALRLHPHADDLEVVVFSILQRHGLFDRYLYQHVAQQFGLVPVVAARQL